MIRALVDTNIVISGTFWKGAERLVLDAAADRRFEALTCATVLTELRRALEGKFSVPPDRARDIERNLLSLSILTPEPPGVLGGADEIILETAAVSGADFVISGDRRMAIKGRRPGVKVLPAPAFLRLL